MKHCFYCFEYRYQSDSVYEILSFKKLNRMQLCKQCLAKLISIDESDNHTSCCQKLKGTESNFCKECEHWEKKYQINICNRALFRYNNFALDILWRIKHNRDIVLAKIFVPIMKNYFYQTYDLSKTLFVPIPSDTRALQERRFSLVHYVLVSLKDYIRIEDIFPTITDIKEKQHKKSKQDRVLYAKDNFAIISNILEILRKHNTKKL